MNRVSLSKLPNSEPENRNGKIHFDRNWNKKLLMYY